MTGGDREEEEEEEEEEMRVMDVMDGVSELIVESAIEEVNIDRVIILFSLFIVISWGGHISTTNQNNNKKQQQNIYRQHP